MRIRNLKLVIFAFSFIIESNSCKQPKNNQSKHEINFIEKTEMINQNLIGEQFNTPLTILGDSIFYNDKVVLLITVSSDCSGCRKKGYGYLTRINELFNNRIAFAVSTGLNESFEKKTNGLDGKLFQDENSTIKQELNLFHTPSLVFLDKNRFVFEILSIFPYDEVDGYDEEKEFDKFVDKIIML